MLHCRNCQNEAWCICKITKRVQWKYEHCLCCECYYQNKRKQKQMKSQEKTNKFRKEIRSLTDTYLSMYGRKK